MNRLQGTRFPKSEEGMSSGRAPWRPRGTLKRCNKRANPGENRAAQEFTGQPIERPTARIESLGRSAPLRSPPLERSAPVQPVQVVRSAPPALRFTKTSMRLSCIPRIDPPPRDCAICTAPSGAAGKPVALRPVGFHGIAGAGQNHLNTGSIAAVLSRLGPAACRSAAHRTGPCTPESGSPSA